MLVAPLGLAFMQVAASSLPCSGFYAYIPQDIEAEVGFSIEVQPTAIEVLWTDYDNMFARKNVQDDGSLRFNDGRGGPFFHLTCSSTGATLSIEADEYNGVRSYQLVRSDVDIWGIARARGWPVDE